jgi:hypothetical protein
VLLGHVALGQEGYALEFFRYLLEHLDNELRLACVVYTLVFLDLHPHLVGWLDEDQKRIIATLEYYIGGARYIHIETNMLSSFFTLIDSVMRNPLQLDSTWDGFVKGIPYLSSVKFFESIFGVRVRSTKEERDEVGIRSKTENDFVLLALPVCVQNNQFWYVMKVL